MRPTDRRLLLAVAALSACAGPDGYRYSAPIEITTPGTFVELPVSIGAYVRSVQPGLADVRIVDAGGARVSFAWLSPRTGEAQNVTETRPATVYPLPPRPARGGTWQAPVEVVVRGDQIRVARSRAEAPAGRRGGWLIDLGPDPAESPRADRIQLEWSGPAEFTAAYTLETSDDLTAWRSAPGGQLISLVSASGPLTQPVVRLPARTGRFVRLEWTDPAGVVPEITGALGAANRTEWTPGDTPAAITLSPMPTTAGDSAGPAFDLGGELPVFDLTPRFAAGNLVVPAVVEGRSRLDEPWRPLGAAVFYRLERSPSEVSTSPPIQIGTGVRYLRLVPDRRAAALDPASVTLEVTARLAHLVFAMQGTAPFRLEVGSATAEAGALPEGVLVPGLAEERTRFGRATLAGAWTESATVAQAADRQSQIAALRPWLLWGVLLAGLAGLGLMVWRLAKQR